MNRSIVRLALVLGVVLFAACSDDPTGTVEVARVEVGPADQVLVTGDSLILTAVPLTRDGDIVVGRVFWRSLNPTVATLRASAGTAVVEAKVPGTVRIEAESGGRVGFVNVTVVAQPQVASVVILPSTMLMQIGQQTALQAQAQTADGAVINGRTVTWTIASGEAATLTPQPNAGWATISARSEGVTVIRATIDGIVGEAEVQVATTTPPPAQIATVEVTPSNFSLPVNHETALQAIAKTASGEVVNGRTVTWTSSAPGSAIVTPIGESAFANVRTIAAGTVIIRATIDGVIGGAVVQVTSSAPPPEQILYLYFSPNHRSVWANQVVSFAEHLTATGSNGPIANPSVQWSVEDESIATVDASGNVRGVSAGTTKVRARSGDRDAVALVTVFEQTGSVSVFDLTFDWWDGQWHMVPVVDRVAWTDEYGVEHDVPLWPASGSLTMSDNGQYERVLVLHGYATVDGAGRKVVERVLVDRGTTAIIVGGETGYWMNSTTTPGYQYVVVGAYNAGHVRMRAVVGTAPDQEYLFRLRQ